MWCPPKTLTVIADSNEQKPILFPSSIVWRDTNAKMIPPLEKKRTFRIGIKVESRRIDAGDYCFAEYPTIVGIERKGSIDELAQNSCTKDATRFINALGRFRDTYEYPILYCDFTVLGLYSVNKKGSKESPDRIIDRFFGTTTFAGIELVFGGTQPTSVSNKRKVGNFLLRLMLMKIAHHERNK